MRTLIGLSLLLLPLFLANLAVGSSNWSLYQYWIHGQGEAFIFWDLRLPRALAACLCGGSLALAGLLMQTFFRNPIAGPYTLGLSSASGLGLSFLWLGLLPLAWLNSPWTNALLSAAGALLVLLALLFAAQRGLSGNALLVLGLILGSGASALSTLLEYFGPAQALQQRMFWSMGNLAGITWTELQVLLPLQIALWLLIPLWAKPLNALLLGERYAQSMGVDLPPLRRALLFFTALLVGSSTAFCGPIAFVGTLAPHAARSLLRSADHRLLLPASLLMGMCMLLLCQWLSLLPDSHKALPLNALTSLLGVPLILRLIWPRKL